MSDIKCGLCGFEFEKGLTICRGCQGHIKYGAGGIKWFFGILYGGITWWLLSYINDNWLEIEKNNMTNFVVIAFILGCCHAAYIFRNRIITEKKV